MKMNKYPILLDRKNIDKFKVKSTLINSNFKRYEILNYDKSVLCYNDRKNSIFKNVVFSYPEKNMLSFMGPKTMSFKSFITEFNSQIKTYFDAQFLVTEFIDGDLINLFYDNRIDKWFLVTKYKRSRKGFLLKPSSQLYRKFIDLLKGGEKDNINDLYILNFFNKKYNYNFKIRNDKIYLITVFKIENFNNIISIKNIYKISYESDLQDLNGIIYYPKEYYFKTYMDPWYESENSDNMPNKYILTHASGMETKLETTDFEIIKRYDSIPNNILYMYLCLKKMKKNFQFIDMFSRFKDNFTNIDFVLNEFFSKINQAYIHYYILKDDDYKEPYMFWVHKIHKEVHIPSLKLVKIKINMESIRTYFLSMHPRELLFILDDCVKKINYIDI